MAAIDLNQLNSLDISGNKLLSDNLTNISTKIASDNTISTSFSQEQAGLVNIKGSIDASTKKSAVLYAPISVANSPSARVSSSPQIDQAGSENPLSGLFSSPNLVIAVAGLGIALFFLTKAAKPSSNVTSYSGKLNAKVPVSALGA